MCPAPINIVFAAQGADAVHSVFRSLKKEAQDLERVQGRASRVVATQQTKAAAEAVKTTQRSVDNMAKIRERSATMAGRIAVQQAKAEVRAAQKVAREKERLDRQTQARFKKAMADEEREIFKVARAKTQADKMAEASQKRIQAKAMAHNAGIARGATGMLGRSARGTIGTVTGVAGSLGLAGGGMMIGNGVMNALDLQRQAALLSNSTSMPGAPGMDPKALVGIARGVAGNTGFKAGDVMEGMNTVAARAGGATGLNAFKGDIEDVAKTAIAAGVSMQDMGAVYAASLNAGVKPGEEMRQLMMDLVAQGKEGAVEFADLAGELAKLAGAGKSWGSGSQMIRRASGIAQVAVEAAVSPEEARTAVKDMVREFAGGPKLAKLKAAGVTVEGAGGKNRDPMELLAETIHAAETKGIGGSKGQAGLSEIFTGASQMSIISTLRENYLNGYTGKDGKAYKGKEAVSQRIADASSGTMTAAQRNEEFQKVMSTDMQKVAVAMEKFGGEMDKLLPKISEMIPQVSKVVEGLAKLAVYAAENPFTALSGIFAAHLTKELAGAGISKMVETGILNILSGKGIKDNAGGTLASIGTIALTATAVYLTAAKVINEIDKNARKEGAGEYANVTKAENLARMVKSGKATKEEMAQAKTIAAGLEDNLGERSAQENVGSALTAGAMGGNAGGAIAMGIEYLFDKFTAQSREAGGGGQSKEDVVGMLETMLKIGAAADKLNAAGDKLNAASLSNPGNPARTSPASSMSTGK